MTLTDTTTTAADTEAALDRLDELAVQLGITAEDHLDELVYDALNSDAADQVNTGTLPDLDVLTAFDELHDDADQRASRINNQGVRAQLAVLLDAHGEPALTALLRELAALGVPA